MTNDTPIYNYTLKQTKQVRCTGRKTKGYRAGEACTKLLGEFTHVTGKIKCPDCGTINDVKI